MIAKASNINMYLKTIFYPRKKLSLDRNQVKESVRVLNRVAIVVLDICTCKRIKITLILLLKKVFLSQAKRNPICLLLKNYKRIVNRKINSVLFSKD